MAAQTGRQPVTILSRYLLRLHVAPFLFALGTVTGLMLLNQIVKQLGSLVGKGLPPGVIIELFALSIPFIIAMTLPMAVLVAVLHTFSQLAAENETTALQASGVSLSRLVRPVFIAGMAFAVAAFLWSDQVLPRTNHALRTLMTDIQRVKPTFTLREQIVNEVQPGTFFLRAARIDQATNRLRDVTIYDLQDPDRQRSIVADSGHMASTPGGTDLYLTLKSGAILEVRRDDPTQFNRTEFTTNVIRVRNVGNELERTIEDNYRSDREMSTCQMDSVIRGADADARYAAARAEVAVTNDLRQALGLATVTVSDSVRRVPPPSWYCRTVARVTAFLSPAPLAAQERVPPPRGRQGPQRRGGSASRPPPVVNVSPPQNPNASPMYQAESQNARSSYQLAAQYRVEYHKKYAIAAAALVFVLVGIPLALRFPRGGVGLVIGASLSVFGLFYIGLIGGEELGDRLIVSPFWAMWAPNFLCTILGLIGLRLVRTHSGTTRGGDLSDLKDWLLGWPGRLVARARGGRRG
jgi:lipopolysaccharide export system permease protein